ncbi:MAG: CdaR family protein [Candidatus Krumholzibacteria bacterium]|nr:CdaR family protein [Candidatus Krumholzibacteria bacterium]MDH4336288.1 CdaR family protein [Candidatus Krumholzibacteria bacterium]MDH5269673.1 CdaR family protein [Candidatus Krumholzibacteria bacterium]MDH5627750.1 CdaR family protein [Candidatus Krumholzibacteria bacterium]
MNVARIITHNLGAKVLALVVAILVWFNASGQEEVISVRSASLVVDGVSDSLALSSSVPASANVRISATRRQMVALGFQRLVVGVDLSGLGPGRQRVPLTGNDVGGIGGIDPGRVQVIAPSVLEVDLEPVASRRLQVSLATVGALPANLVLLEGGVVIEPAWITVRGPSSRVDRIQHVTTEPVDLSRVRDSGTRDVNLDCADARLVCDPDRVTVSFRVSPRGERVLPNVPPTVLLDSDDVEAAVDPSMVSLTLQGPMAVLDTLSSGDVSVLLTVAGGAPAIHRIAAEVILPPGVRLAAISADSFEVRVVPVVPVEP